jgi:hypothetical protein
MNARSTMVDGRWTGPSQPPSNEPDDRRAKKGETETMNRRFTSLAVSALFGAALIALGAPPVRAAAPPSPQMSTNPVQGSSATPLVSDGSVVPNAYSTLLRDEDGVTVRLNTSKLPAGTVDTLWWIIFNHPEKCTHGSGGYRCGAADIGDPAVDASVIYADGRAVGPAGKAHYGASLDVNDPTGALVGYGTATGLHNPMGAEIWLIVHGHGTIVPEVVGQQLHNFPGCFPPNVDGKDCADLQISVHQAK